MAADAAGSSGRQGHPGVELSEVLGEAQGERFANADPKVISLLRSCAISGASKTMEARRDNTRPRSRVMARSCSGSSASRAVYAVNARFNRSIAVANARAFFCWDSEPSSIWPIAAMRR